MNHVSSTPHDEFLHNQTLRLQDLIAETVHCCEDRRLYEAARFGLPYAELKCLMLFRRPEDTLSVKAVAEGLEVAKSRASKIVSGLLQRGLLSQSADPRDGRLRMLRLTTEGRRKAQTIRAFETELHRRLLLLMAPSERRRVLASLEMLRSAMDTLKAQLT